jgi:serine phosphatase RsbU (regulator of sigma subunit)
MIICASKAPTSFSRKSLCPMLKKKYTLTRTLKYYLIGLTFGFCSSTLFSQPVKIDSLKTALESSNKDSIRCIILNELFEIASETNKIIFNEQLKAISEINLENSSTSSNVFFYKTQLGISLNNFGEIYADQGDIVKALEYCNQSLKTMKEIGNKKGIAQALYQIGEIYIGQTDYVKALTYSQQSLEIMEEIGDKRGIADCLEDIGNYTEFQDKNLQKALEYYQRALKLSEQINYKKRTAYLQGNIARVYSKLNNLNEALKYNFLSLKIKEELGDKRGIGYSFHKIGQVYYLQGNIKLALEYGQKSMILAKNLGFPESIKRSADLLTLVYKKQGDYKKSSEMFELYIVMRDSLNNIALQKVALQKQLQFEYEQRKQKYVAEQEKKNAINQEQQEKQKIITWSIFFFLILALLFAAFIFRSLRLTNKQKKIIEEKNKDITDSITYAQRIQNAQLPIKTNILASLPKSFILFKPKDIVSGDFYFFHKTDQCVFIAAADCTGHGVPGAFMSMIGSEKLEDAVTNSIDTSVILNQLNKGIKTSLRQSDSDESTRDGMDIALCSVDTQNFIVKYAGANRPIWIIRSGQTEVEEIKATKTAIGGLTEDNQYFDTHEIKLEQGDTFYICTDGYADQFSGQDGKKLMTRKFKEILVGIQNKTMQEQEMHLDNFVEKWKAGTEQVDDILVIGVRL